MERLIRTCRKRKSAKTIFYVSAGVYGREAGALIAEIQESLNVTKYITMIVLIKKVRRAN